MKTRVCPVVTTSFGSYDDLIQHFGYEVVLEEDLGDYQGDTLVLFRDQGEWGYLCFGWGSCSGCDSLQACESIQDYVDLFSHLFNSIQWFEGPRPALHWMCGHDWRSDYHGGENSKFYTPARERLAQEVQLDLSLHRHDVWFRVVLANEEAKEDPSALLRLSDYLEDHNEPELSLYYRSLSCG